MANNANNTNITNTDQEEGIFSMKNTGDEFVTDWGSTKIYLPKKIVPKKKPNFNANTNKALDGVPL
jgi:hypothetical protein